MIQPEEKVLILAPVGQDAPAVAALLGAQGISTVICSEPGTCLSQMGTGAGALLLTEEALEMSRCRDLLDALRAQPTWSELPLIVLTSGGESRRVSLLDLAASAAGGVTLLERPMTSVTLLRSVQVALRSRRRQYRARDLIAEHQRAEDALRETAERLSLAQRAGRVGVFDWDLITNNVVWTPEMEEIFGLPQAGFENRYEGWTKRVHGEDLPRLEAMFAAWLRSDQDEAEWEYRFLRGGEERWIAARGRMIRDPTRKPVRMVGTNLDITERKQAEAVLARSKEELERLVTERTARLAEMVSELHHVSYAIVHDMRAPLRAMAGFANTLDEGLSDTMPREEAREYCRRIRVGATRLDKLIIDALSYTQAVLLEVQMSPVPLSPLVHGLLETYPNFHPDKADIRVEGELPVVNGNEALLTQCFSNLLGNAVKFVAPGVRPSVRVRTEAVEEGKAGQCVRIWIEDNGVGIPPNAQKRLFGMFQKLDNQYEGTGIGLAIVRKVVERMGGKVGAESEPGKGSRFWVELPLCASV